MLPDASLTPTMPGTPLKPDERGHVDVAAGPARHVVDDDRQADLAGNRAVMLEEPFGRRLVVVGRHRQDARRARLLHPPGGVDDFLRVVSAGAGEHRHPPGGFLDDELHDADALVFRQRRTLARRPARDEKVDTGVDLAPREAPDARFVDRTLARERRHQCRSASRPWRSHQLLPNTRESSSTVIGPSRSSCEVAPTTTPKRRASRTIRAGR